MGAVRGGYYAFQGNTSSNKYQDFEIEIDIYKFNEFGKKLFINVEGKKFCDEVHKKMEKK